MDETVHAAYPIVRDGDPNVLGVRRGTLTTPRAIGPGADRPQGGAPSG